MKFYSYDDGDRPDNTVRVSEYDEEYFVRADGINGVYAKFPTQDKAEAYARYVAAKYNRRARLDYSRI